MEKRKLILRKTGERKATRNGMVSDAESTVSTHSSNSSSSSNTSGKPKQRRSKSGRPSNRKYGDAIAKKQEQLKRDEDTENPTKTLVSRLGVIIETTEAQIGMILLIALDVCCTAVAMYLQNYLVMQQLCSNENKNTSNEASASLLVQIVLQLVESFTGFTLFLFIIELSILLAAFGYKVFEHGGFVLDLAHVSISLVVELYAQTRAMRLLGILRSWRVLRLVRQLVDQERIAHDATRLVLEQEELKLLQVQMQKDAAYESLKREDESRTGLEQLLRGYKDEIATLKEALEIAAQAVAEATMNAFSPADPSLHDVSKAVVVDSASALHPVGVENEDREESYLYQQTAAAVYPTELQTDLERQYWLGNEGHQYQKTTTSRTAVSGLDSWQSQGTVAALKQTKVLAELNLDHGQESERSDHEFEDAVGE